MRNEAYMILGLGSDATQSDIKFAYRLRVKECHPDIHPAAGLSEELKKINAAYALISTPARRAQYDERQKESLGRPLAPATAAESEIPEETAQHARRQAEFRRYREAHQHRLRQRAQLLVGFGLAVAGFYVLLSALFVH